MIIYYRDNNVHEMYIEEGPIGSAFRMPGCQDLSEYLVSRGLQLILVDFQDDEGIYKNPDFKVLPSEIQRSLTKEGVSLKEIKEEGCMVSNYRVLVFAPSMILDAYAYGNYVFCEHNKSPFKSAEVLAIYDSIRIEYLKTRSGVDIYQSEEEVCDPKPCLFGEYIEYSSRLIKEFESCRGIRI